MKKKVCVRCNNDSRRMLEKIKERPVELKFGRCAGCKQVFCTVCLISAVSRTDENGKHVLVDFDPVCSDCLKDVPEYKANGHN